MQTAPPCRPATFPPHRGGIFPSGDAAPVGATLTCICSPNASQACSASPLLKALLLPTGREDPMDLLCRSHQPLRWYGAFKVAEAIFADPNRFRDGGNGRNGAGGLRNNRRDRCYRRAPSRRSWHGRLALNVSQADAPSCVLRFIFILHPMFFQQTTGIYIQVLGEPVRCNILAEDL